MDITPRMRSALPFLAVLMLFSCKGPSEDVMPDAAFAPYVSAFTAGHISTSASIYVRIADEQTWRDTSAATLQSLFSFDPSVKGSVSWYDHRTLSFTPSERLAADRSYQVTFHLGRMIDVPDGLEEMVFTVITFKQGIDVRVSDLRSLSPADLTWQQLVVTVSTSDAADASALEECFTLNQEGRDLALTWEHEPNGRYHRFVADSVKRGERASDILLEWNGQRIDSDDQDTLHFPVPSLNDLRLISTEVVSDGDQYATLLFSDPLSTSQDITGLAGIGGADHVRITVEGNRLIMYPGDRLSGDYEGYVSEGLENVNGRRLGKDISVELRFEELKPAIRLVGKGVILPSSDGLVFPFEAVNLSAVEARIIRIYADNVAQFLQVNEMDGERELARVGRLVSHTVVPLRAKDNPDAGRWNRYYLDLEEQFRSEPGAIYRVELSFRPEHSVYPCEGVKAGNGAELTEISTQDDDAEWDTYEDRYYYDDWYYDDYDEEYDHSQRHDPCSPSYYGRRHTVSRNVLASDIGIIAKRGNDGGLFMAVSDLRSAKPLAGVKLDVLDLQRRSMAQVITDGEGLATLPRPKHKPFLLVASQGTQRGYLRMTDGSSLSVSEYDVRGSSVDKGLKGFIHGERGVWRPGDSLYLSFMLEDELHTLPKDHPVVFELTDPRGRVVQKMVRTHGVDGVYSFHCATDPDAPTGNWGARISVGGAHFHRSLRIETIKPNRIKMALDLGGDRITRSSLKDAVLQANWLHGSPARDLKARITLTLTTGSPEFKGQEKYDFSDLRTDLSNEERVVFDGKLDASGAAKVPMNIELNSMAPPVVRANFVTRVFETGGDASMDRSTVSYYPYESYVGIRAPETRSSWGTLVTDTTYAFSVVAVDPEGKVRPGRALKAQIYKLSYNWWWDGNVDGLSNYVSSPSVEIREVQELTTDAKGRAVIRFRMKKPDWGRFAVRILDPESGHSAASQVYVDWPGWEGRSRRQTPEEAAMLTFNSDKEKYNVGDIAELIIPSSGTGRALVSLETGSRILDAVWIDLANKETRHKVPITADMAPNVYAHVSVIQPHAQTANDLPIRLYGVIPILVEDPITHLAPVIAMGAEIRTDKQFSVAVKEKDGRGMTYTLAIVDEGLLDLTRFRTPDPWGHFYAREALGVTTWDMYDQVIGAFGRQLHRILALGGSDEAGPAEGARAQRFKPVVRYVGPFQLKAGGENKHAFTINEYVGSVRVMVVATDGDGAYGNAERTVPVKKPLMLLATLPRVVGPGETVDLPVTVFAMDKKVKDVKVTLASGDLLTAEDGSTRSIRFDEPGDAVVRFRVKVAEAIGVARVKVTVEGAGESATSTMEIQVRQPNLPQTLVSEVLLKPGEKWSDRPVAVGVQGTNSAYLEISTIPPVDLGRRLKYLIGYPHGCVEQTTSKAFPQLYLADVMEMDDRMAMEMRRNVEVAIHRLRSFQRSDGAFNYWPGSDHYDDWCSAYVGHFLLEAERKGFAVPADMRDRWASQARRSARDWSLNNDNRWSRRSAMMVQAYRLYVLALTNSPEMGAMNRMRTMSDLDINVRWTLASAYAAAGQRSVALQLVQGIDRSIAPYREMAYTYGSDLRDNAIIADALLRMGDDAGAAGVIKGIAERLSSEEWHSTQTTAFALMAVARMAERNDLAKGMSFNIERDGSARDRHSSKAIYREDLAAPNGKWTVGLRNTGKSLLYVRLVRTGTPLPGKETASSKGLSMVVEYRYPDGRPLDPTVLEQGSDLIALVTVLNPGVQGDLDQLALTQIFPSGWEIRNSRMEGTDNIQKESGFTYRDVRDDRVHTYFDLYRGRTVTYKVLLNASYTGRFYLPAPACEAMYDHTVSARGAGQWVEVIASQGQATGQR